MSHIIWNSFLSQTILECIVTIRHMMERCMVQITLGITVISAQHYKLNNKINKNTANNYNRIK